MKFQQILNVSHFNGTLYTVGLPMWLKVNEKSVIRTSICPMVNSFHVNFVKFTDPTDTLKNSTYKKHIVCTTLAEAIKVAQENAPVGSFQV